MSRAIQPAIALAFAVGAALTAPPGWGWTVFLTLGSIDAILGIHSGYTRLERR
jgi:hypothetical protein